MTFRFSRASRVRGGLAVAAATVLALTTGCGVSGETLRPGVAAEVGGSSISLKSLDKATNAFCDWNKTNDQTPLLTGYAGRTAMLEGLVVRTIADKMNDATYHKTPGDFYAQQLKGAQQSLALLSPDQLADLLPAYTGYAYFVDLVGQFGAAPGAAAPTDTNAALAAFQKGLPLVVSWSQDHPIDTDPSLPAVTVDPTNILSTRDQDVSQIVSDFAQQASDAAQPTPTGNATAFAASLPASQQCG